jgi:hypothetical protein
VGQNEHGSKQTRAARPGLRKEIITPITCLKFCIVLQVNKCRHQLPRFLNLKIINFSGVISNLFSKQGFFFNLIF